MLLKQSDFKLKLRDAPIQQKLVRVIMLSCFTVLVLVISAYIILEYYSFRKTAQKDVITLGEIIASNSAGVLAFDSRQDAQEILNGLKANPHLVAACLYDKNGKIFATYESNTSTIFPTASQWVGYRFKKGHIEGFSNVIQGNTKMGTLYLKSDLKAMYEQIRYYTLIGILLIIVSLIVAFILSNLLQKSISEPIIALKQTATIISDQNNYSIRATEYGNDEVGSLTRSFNRMLTHIEVQNQEIMLFNQDLDMKVKERTKLLQELTVELQEKNAALKFSEEILETKNAELQAKNKELESFNYISSHDLQEPLRQIQIFSSRISDVEQQNLSDTGKTYFDKMNNAAKRMQNLIADLLAYSRTKTEARKFKITNLNQIINDVTEEFAEIISDKHVTIEVTELGNADVIPFQFRQMMYNLIGNALKFSIPDTPPHIIIKNEKIKSSKVPGAIPANETEYYHISISDNGIGFEPQYKDRIFEVFQRLHDKQKIAGTGIGLAIVKNIVENHYGIITATGELNKGATFDIYIPTNQKNIS